MPKGFAEVKGQNGANTVDIKKQDLPTQIVTAQDSQAKISDIFKKPGYISFKVLAPKSTQVTINRTDFPVWVLYQNGQKANFKSNNKFKLMETTVPQGTTKIVAAFTDTPLRTYSNLLSAFSIGIIALYASIRIFSKKLL